MIILECDLKGVYTGHPRTTLKKIDEQTYPRTLAYMNAYLGAQEEIGGDGTVGCFKKMGPLLKAAGFQREAFSHEPCYLTSHGQRYFLDLLETVKHVVVGRGCSFDEMQKEVNNNGENIFYVNYLVVAEVRETQNPPPTGG